MQKQFSVLVYVATLVFIVTGIFLVKSVDLSVSPTDGATSAPLQKKSTSGSAQRAVFIGLNSTHASTPLALQALLDQVQQQGGIQVHREIVLAPGQTVALHFLPESSQDWQNCGRKITDWAKSLSEPPNLEFRLANDIGSSGNFFVVPCPGRAKEYADMAKASAAQAEAAARNAEAAAADSKAAADKAEAAADRAEAAAAKAEACLMKH